MCDCSSRHTEVRSATERSVYALSCGTVSLVEFIVNHIAFIARFSSLSSCGLDSLHAYPYLDCSRDLYKNLDAHYRILCKIKSVNYCLRIFVTIKANILVEKCFIGFGECSHKDLCYWWKTRDFKCLKFGVQPLSKTCHSFKIYKSKPTRLHRIFENVKVWKNYFIIIDFKNCKNLIFLIYQINDKSWSIV